MQDPGQHVIASKGIGRRPQSFDDEAVPYIMLSNVLTTPSRSERAGIEAQNEFTRRRDLMTISVCHLLIWVLGAAIGGTVLNLLVIPISPLVLAEADDGKL